VWVGGTVYESQGYDETSSLNSEELQSVPCVVKDQHHQVVMDVIIGWWQSYVIRLPLLWLSWDGQKAFLKPLNHSSGFTSQGSFRTFLPLNPRTTGQLKCQDVNVYHLVFILAIAFLIMKLWNCDEHLLVIEQYEQKHRISYLVLFSAAREHLLVSHLLFKIHRNPTNPIQSN